MYVSAFFVQNRLIKALMHTHFYQIYRRRVSDERQDFWCFTACRTKLMLPIAILPVAGLLLGIGSSFTNATTIETYGLTKILGDGTLLHSLLVIMNSVGMQSLITCH